MSGATAAESSNEGESNETDTGKEGGQVSEEKTTGESSATSKSTDTNPPNEDSSNEGKVDLSHKPEWLDERVYVENFAKYGDKLDMEKVAQHFAKQHTNAQDLLNRRKDIIRSEVEEELKAKRMENVPESSKDYIFNKLLLADELGLAVETNDDDPIMLAAKTWAHKHGLTQADFDEMAELHLKAVSSFFPDWEQEKVILGEYADERHRALNAWAGKVLAPEVYDALDSIPLSANLIMVLEAFQELSGTKPFDADTGEGGNTLMTREDIRALMDTEEYRRGDPATLQKVQNGFKRLAG